MIDKPYMGAVHDFYRGLPRVRELDDNDVPAVEKLNSKILAAIDAGGVLEMEFWHGREHYETCVAAAWKPVRACGTTHCVAGWAVMLAGEAGHALEARVGSEAAGMLIFAKSTGYVPDFSDVDEDALEALRERAAEEA
jgi:hypothetical protein